ncbi:hypothetical protein ACFSKW_12805 [Nonomuraea mangrovi]|uniref:DUF2154 domain-containing protein n=1 Tax=Nonomuraea mangrovi TaxID=2316207 RepID=A0ABW4STU5_9ACTN
MNTIAFVPGAAGITIGSDAKLETPYRAGFDGVLPDVRVHGGTVTVVFPRSFHVRDRRRAGEVVLKGTEPWRIEVRGGTSRLTADLRGLRVTALDLQGGAEQVAVELPAPEGSVPVRIAGGASHVRFGCPTSVPVRLSLIGGGTGITFGERHLGAVGAGTTLADPGWQDGTDRYDILVTGGADTLTVERW